MWCTSGSQCGSGTCSQVTGGSGSCSGATGCGGQTVVIDMQKGNTIKDCFNLVGGTNWPGSTYAADWYTIKGALGENVTFTFKANNCKPSAYLFYADNGCTNANLNYCLLNEKKCPYDI